ncbi:hypothetical protein BDV96DRAFT_646365 [Lophiotrema nucula]|uniref:Uncharacterized protein n=1 Tax=Lophiotrema nucula TaxID=690887 RepID=A0A6A5Z7D5_9PLEO|nr:hypothetical protein BDV96DRAFT_646365 [Lophiotrema nucula]
MPPSGPPSAGPFSPTSPYSIHTPSTTASYSSKDPFFSPKTGYERDSGQWQSFQTTPGTGYHQPFDQHQPNNLPTRPRKLIHQISHTWQRLWLWETCACVLAVGAHLAMIAMLGVYDDARESSWTRPWTLNSMISFMITIIKGAAMIPIAASLGQLKWRRFWTYRRLTDLDVYDEASRGTLGSLRLIWDLRVWHFATFGAILTVAALTMDTMAQNVVSTVQRLEVTGGEATAPRNNNYATYNVYTSGEDPGDQLPWPSMVSAINFGMSYTASMFWAGSLLPVDCLTGNCTFGPYQSLGVENICHDVTHLLDKSDASVYSLPDGPFLRANDGLINISSTTDYPTNDLFPDIGPLITNFQAIANPSLEEPVAIQCALYWAVSTYTASNMTNYTFYEPTTSVWTNTTEEAMTKYNQTEYIYMTPPECWVNGTQFKDTSDERCLNWVGSLAQLGLQNFLISDSIGMTGEAYQVSKTGFFVSNLFANAANYVTTHALSNATYNMLELTVNNTAIMITQGVRQLPTLQDDGNFTWAPVNGTVYQYETFFDIHFYWLGATHAVVGGSMLFMCITIWLTRCDHPWKTSTLPLLFHGLSPQDRATVADVPQMIDMRIAADSLKVKMTMTAVGQRLATRETIASG